MFNNLVKNILFILIIVGLPILVNMVVNVLSSIITMEMIMKVVYVALIALGIYFVKEGI